MTAEKVTMVPPAIPSDITQNAEGLIPGRGDDLFDSRDRQITLSRKYPMVSMKLYKMRQLIFSLGLRMCN
jgi:hypothetical protein